MIRLNAIKPRAKALDFTRFASAAKLGMRDAAKAAVKDFHATTATWQHQPTFTIKPRADGYDVDTDDEIYGYVDKGTRAHRIIARRAKRLRFAAGGSPKTAPGRISSGRGSRGSGDVFRQSVNHPGTKARQFSKLIGAKYRAQLQRFIQVRIKEAM